jgi:hypothetical protein
MIISDQYLREIQSVYKPEYITVEPVRIVAEWCNDYYQRYGKAPNTHIKDLYQHHAEKTLDEEHSEYIADFLASISDEHARADKFNAHYLIDQSLGYFKEQSLRNTADDIRGALNAGDVAAAEEFITQFNIVDKPIKVGIDPFTNVDAIQSSFAAREEPLFKLPGAIGDLMNSQFTREALISLQGPEKRGKTWWLITLGMWAHRARCNVAMFGVGDMSQDQMIRRQHIYLSKRSDDARYCGELFIPTLDCMHSQLDDCNMQERVSTFGVVDDGVKVPYDDAPNYTPCTYCMREHPKRYVGAYWWQKRDPVRPLTWQEAYRAGQIYVRRVRGKGFKLATYPNDTVNVKDIDRVLDQWEVEEGFVPDVIITDYADILAPEDPRKEARHQVNDTWKALRRLGQERKACVITATQADAASYEQKSVKLKNFSEDKRKYSHVTAVFGLNQMADEKRDGVMRIGEMLIREDMSSDREVVTLGRLEIGRPLISSYWLPRSKKP